MSFSDMMSSARGPGVIGTLLALVVMAIFVMLFVFAFDDRFQGGGQSIESVIKQQAREIDSYTYDIAEHQKILSEFPILIRNSKELESQKRENDILGARIHELHQKVGSAKADLAESIATLEGYKDQYRAFVRGKAKGEVIESLEIQGGIVYKNVSIREVTPIGIQIRHEAGHKRIAYEYLPEAMQDYFQFDSKQKAEAIANEQAEWDGHSNAVLAAKDISAKQAAETAELQETESRNKNKQLLIVYESRCHSLSNEISSLENAIMAEMRKKGIRKTSEMNERLAAKKSELTALRANIAKLRDGQ